jgi:hypothetical protein
MVCLELERVNGRFPGDCDRKQAYPLAPVWALARSKKLNISGIREPFLSDFGGPRWLPCRKAASRPLEIGVIYKQLTGIGATEPSRRATLGPIVARFLLKPAGLTGDPEPNKPR